MTKEPACQKKSFLLETLNHIILIQCDSRVVVL